MVIKLHIIRFLPFFAAAVVLVFVFILCSGCYTLKQGVVMLGYLGKAVPLEDLSAEASKTISAGKAALDAEKTLAFVERVADIRRFAMEELGLKESKNYTRYVELDRDYLAAVVSAGAADSFAAHEWWFPVAGTVPYKGFFNLEDAKKEAARLKGQGLDVWVRGVDAFSTLGWFRDPLYSYMRDYSAYQLADLIIHELFHATVYIKGNSQFNEELAEFVGSHGAKLYIASRFGEDSDEYAALSRPNADNDAYVTFIHELIAELETLYSQGVSRSRETILAEKERIIKAAQARFAEEYDSRFSSDAYRSFSELPVNNAYLALYRLYYAGDNYLEELYSKSGSDLTHFIAAAKTIKGKKNPRAQLEAILS